METQTKAVCAENELVMAHLLSKRQELAQSAKGISEKLDMTLSKAYSNICNCKTPIRTLRDLSQIKGVGKWILKQMQGFFQTDSGPTDNDDSAKNGNKKKGRKRYMPQKNSVAYALLITLFRNTESGTEYMLKKDLIDAAEISGLSRAPIAPEKAKGNPGHFGSSPRDWYSGWSCMKTLINRGLVVKASCPAKYMLTEEGKEAARECLLRSGMINPDKSLNCVVGCSNLNKNKKDTLRVNVLEDLSDIDCDAGVLTERAASYKQEKSKTLSDMQPEYLDKFINMGFSRQQIIRAFSEVMETSGNKEIASIWPTVLCRLREDEIFGSTAVRPIVNDHCDAPSSNQHTDQAGLCTNENIQPHATAANRNSLHCRDFERSSFTIKACSSTEFAVNKSAIRGSESRPNTLALPPLAFGEKFGDAYEVILILDNREQFATQGSRSRKIIDNISSQFQVQIEVRRLPVGDCIWIARHKYLGTEYVLDFIVERKKVDDLHHSIRDNRYRDQKMRLVRCGLKKMIYLVEGDPNTCEAAESIKTACFTTEVLEGFDVQRTTGLADTLRKYGYLTKSINEYYASLDPEEKCGGICPPFDEFIKRCEELDKLTVSDVFATQLMQVPQVTEDIALAVLDMYPTLLSLAQSYAFLDGDVRTQEEMLTKQSNNLISGAASRNIFQLLWGS